MLDSDHYTLKAIYFSQSFFHFKDDWLSKICSGFRTFFIYLPAMQLAANLLANSMISF